MALWRWSEEGLSASVGWGDACQGASGWVGAASPALMPDLLPWHAGHTSRYLPFPYLGVPWSSTNCASSSSKRLLSSLGPISCTRTRSFPLTVAHVAQVHRNTKIYSTRSGSPRWGFGDQEAVVLPAVRCGTCPKGLKFSGVTSTAFSCTSCRGEAACIPVVDAIPVTAPPTLLGSEWQGIEGFLAEIRCP